MIWSALKLPWNQNWNPDNHMAQQLIVEGNDAIALAVLCKSRGLPPPSGYHSDLKFRNEFVKNGLGFHGALRLLKEALDQNELTNIGIVVDADNAGASARRDSIFEILSGKFQEESLKSTVSRHGYHIIREENMPVVGIWIMPNNSDNGYLEHFLGSLIDSKDDLWSHAQNTISGLMSSSFNKISRAREQKALLHTWLAWQKDPGKPFGQAISANYFDVMAGAVDPFLAWFEETFELSSKP